MTQLARLLCTAAAAATLCAPSTAGAEPAAAITGTDKLVTFDTVAPGTVGVRPISGLQTSGETVIGLDVRPATGQLYAVTSETGVAAGALIRSYTLDPHTAAATFVGSFQDLESSTGDHPSGVDINPVADRIRVAQSNAANFRISPATGGSSGIDANLSFVAPATGPVSGAAYDRSVSPAPSATTLYEIDAGADRLVRQGGLDGTPPFANGGVVSDVGPLGVTVVDSSDAGFDISPTGTAYATLTRPDGRGLYAVKLTSGAATLAGCTPLELRSLAILRPDDGPVVNGDAPADLDGDGVADSCDSDLDGDGVSNSAEQARGTNPTAPDSDGDGKDDAADSCPVISGATPSGCPAPDLTAPGVALSKLPKSLTYAKFVKKGLALGVTPNEPAGFEIALLGQARTSAGLAKAGNLVLAERNLQLAGGTRTITLKPKRKLLGSARRFTIRLKLVATDAARNRATITRSVRVR